MMVNKNKKDYWRGDFCPLTNPPPPAPIQEIVLGEDGAPILLNRSVDCVWVLAKTASEIKVSVPLNPATSINIQLVNRGYLDGVIKYSFVYNMFPYSTQSWLFTSLYYDMPGTVKSLAVPLMLNMVQLRIGQAGTRGQ